MSAVNMYYSSESSDSENAVDNSSLDYSYLMLDSDSLAVHLRNSVREQHIQRNKSSASEREKKGVSPDTQGGVEEEGEGRHQQDLCFNLEPNAGGVDSNGDGDRDSGSQSHDTITQRLLLQHNMLLTLPFEIVKFSHLKSLDLSNNNLTHVNDFLLHLPMLQSLYLQSNNLADDGLPKDLSVLTNLRELNLSGNKFSRVPPQLYEMVSLRYLYLGSNEITEVLPDIKALQR